VREAEKKELDTNEKTSLGSLKKDIQDQYTSILEALREEIMMVLEQYFE
jgi:hypothetical protein